MNIAAASHDGLPDTIAPERLLAKKIKEGVATPDEALEWLRITAFMRGNAIGVTACELIKKHFISTSPTTTPGEHIMNINELPAIGSPFDGGIYAGISRGENGQPDAPLILLNEKPDDSLDWNDAMKWAEGLGNDARLPTLCESALLYAHLKDQFEPRWHWTSTQYSSDFAYVQGFAVGSQGYAHKDNTLRARAVRRLSVI